MSTREGKVVFVKQNTPSPPSEVVVNLGSQHGVNWKTQFVIYTLGDELRDPDTGESLGKLEILKGRGRPKHIQDQITTVIPITRKQRRVTKNTNIYSMGGETVEEVDVEEDFDRAIDVGDHVRMHQT
jgi:hypothetical protein